MVKLLIMITNEESKTDTPALQIETPEQKGSEEPSASVNTTASMPAGSNPEKNSHRL